MTEQMSTRDIEALTAEVRRALAKARKQDELLDDRRAQAVNRIFDRYDSQDNGFITMQNFRESADSIYGWDSKLFPECFKKLDTTGDSTLTKPETADALALLEAAKTFDKTDRDQTGILSKNEWITVSMKMGFSAQDAQNIFDEFDDDANGVMDYMEFLQCMVDLQGVFMMRDVQTRIDNAKTEIVKIEKMVSGLLSEISGHTTKLDKAKARKDDHSDTKSKAQKKVDEHLSFFSDKKGKVEGHKEHLDLLSMTVGEIKSKFVQYKAELRQAFENKQWDVCLELSEELAAIKYELDEQTGQHTLALQAHANESSVLESKTVDHAQADVELRHLHDLLMEAEAHHDEIAAAHGGALGELRDAERKYEELKSQISRMEQQGARCGVGNAMKKLEKVLGKNNRWDAKIIDLCKRFNMYFKIKEFKEIGLIGLELIATQNKIDRSGDEKIRLFALLKDKKREMDMLARRNEKNDADTRSAEDRARNEFR